MSIWFIFNNNNPKILSLHDHTTVIFEESGLLPQLEGFLLILKTAQIRFFSCCLSTSGLICLFVFIWKASAKTNQGKKKKLAVSETKLVENVLLCLSDIITLILLQSSPTF